MDFDEGLSFFRVLRLVDGMAKARQRLGQRRAEAVRVLNEEQAHGKAKCEDAVLANSLAGQSSGSSVWLISVPSSAIKISKSGILAPVGEPVGAQR
jgi:hypothetical protein